VRDRRRAEIRKGAENGSPAAIIVPACGLRLTGLVGQGATPWAKVGFGAFCVAVLSRLLYVVLLGRSSKTEVPTAKTQKTVFAVSLFDVVSGIGASVAGSTLLA